MVLSLASFLKEREIQIRNFFLNCASRKPQLQRLGPSLMLMHVCLVDTFQPLHISTSSFLTCRNNCKTFSHDFFEVSLEKNYLALDILLYIEKYSKSDPKSAEKKWAFLELLPNMGSTYTQYIQTPSTTKSQSNLRTLTRYYYYLPEKSQLSDLLFHFRMSSFRESLVP